MLVHTQQWRIQGRPWVFPPPPPHPALVLDQNEAQKAEKEVFLRPGSPFISGSGWPLPHPPPLPPYLKVWIRHCTHSLEVLLISSGEKKRAVCIIQKAAFLVIVLKDF